MRKLKWENESRMCNEEAKVSKMSKEYLRRDYATRYGNFILYYNFLTNSWKFIKVHIIRKGISQGR